MSEITFKYDEKDVISAFAFNTGKLIEKLIDERTQNLEDKYKVLEAKVMHYYMTMPDGEAKSQFGGFFGIIRTNTGRI